MDQKIAKNWPKNWIQFTNSNSLAFSALERELEIFHNSIQIQFRFNNFLNSRARAQIHWRRSKWLFCFSHHQRQREGALNQIDYLSFVLRALQKNFRLSWKRLFSPGILASMFCFFSGCISDN